MLNIKGVAHINYSNDEYSQFIMYARTYTNIYPPPAVGESAGRVRHILLDTDSVKRAATSEGNDGGDTICAPCAVPEVFFG